MWSDNKLTEQIKIQYPIIQAGMAGGVTTPELVAAVSNAGGLENVEARYMTAEDMRQTIHAIHRLTDKPFGVNVFVPEHPEVTQDHMDQTNELLAPIRKNLGITPTFVENAVSSKLFEEQIGVLLEEDVP